MEGLPAQFRSMEPLDVEDPRPQPRFSAWGRIARCNTCGFVGRERLRPARFSIFERFFPFLVVLAIGLFGIILPPILIAVPGYLIVRRINHYHYYLKSTDDRAYCKKCGKDDLTVLKETLYWMHPSHKSILAMPPTYLLLGIVVTLLMAVALDIRDDALRAVIGGQAFFFLILGAVFSPLWRRKKRDWEGLRRPKHRENITEDSGFLPSNSVPYGVTGNLDSDSKQNRMPSAESDVMSQCPRCKQENIDDAAFCACGKDLRTRMSDLVLPGDEDPVAPVFAVCPRCHQEHGEPTAFCTCGKDLRARIPKVIGPDQEVSAPKPSSEKNRGQWKL